MSRMDLLRDIKNGNYYIDRAFIIDYCRYFGDLDDEGRRKLLGADNCQKIGDALERERRMALNQIEEGKLNVEWPGGYMIKRHPPGVKRQKYKALIPDDTPRKTCIKMIDEILGIDNPIINPPSQDKRTAWENRMAELQQQVDDIPF